MSCYLSLLLLGWSVSAGIATGSLIGHQPADAAQQEPASKSQEATEWNKKGIEALDKKDFDAALDSFQRALALEPKDEIIQLNLARAYGYRGRAHMRAGRLPQALEDFTAGSKIHRDEGVLETYEARVHLNLGRRELARQRLQDVLKSYPAHVPAVRLAADLAAVSGDLQGAVALLQNTLENHVDDESLRGRLKQLQEEQKAWEGFLTDSSAHFNYRYDPRKPSIVDAVPSLMTDLEDAYQAVAAELGLTPSDRILVLVLDRERYQGGAPKWSGGLYDGRIRLAVGNYGEERESIRATLRHEYTHAALHRLGPQLPTWLHEGFAQMVEGRSPGYARRRLQHAQQALPELASLSGNWTAWTDHSRVNQAYDYALSFVQFFRESYGATVYTLLFESVRYHGFEDGFRRTFGKPVELVDAEHREFLTN